MSWGVVDEPAVKQGGCMGMNMLSFHVGAFNVSALASAVLVFIVLMWPSRKRRVVLSRFSFLNRSKPELFAPIARLGCHLGKVFGVEPADELFLGVAVFGLVAVAVVVGPVGFLLAVAAAVMALSARRRARLRAFEEQIERCLPEVVELLGLVVAAGRSTTVALQDVAPRLPEPFHSELTEIVRRTSAGEPFVESVRRLRLIMGSSVASLVYSLVAAEVDGVPLQPALERVSDEASRRRRVRAEEAARRVPVLMLFPLVFCILPAFCFLTVVPLLVASIADLEWGNAVNVIG